MKQIIIDYEEYLRLEKADKNLQKIINIATPGVVVVKKYEAYADPLAAIPELKAELEFNDELKKAIIDLVLASRQK